MISDVYNAKILDFAGNIPRIGRLNNPDATATAHARLCGSTVTVDIKMAEDVVTEFAHDVKACALGLDLHPAIFPIGGAASTFIDHTNVSIWREADNGEGYAAFGVLMLSTFAESLWHTILDASAEYGAGILAG